MKRVLLAALAWVMLAVPVAAQWQVPQYAVPIGRGSGIGFSSALCTSAQLLVGQSAAAPLCKTITGDVTISAAGAAAIGATKVTSAMLNADVFSTARSWGGPQTFVAPVLGAATGTSLMLGGVDMATTFTNKLSVGNGSSSAAISVGQSDSNKLIAYWGYNATPASAIAFIATSSYANPINIDASAITINDASNGTTNIHNGGAAPTGTGAYVRQTGGTLVAPNLGTPASGVMTNVTGLPLSGLTAQAAYTIVANATGSSAVPTAVSIPALTQKASPVAGDMMLIVDSAASNSFKYATVSSIAVAGSVASIAGNTGAFTLSGLLTNSTNDLRVTAATQSDQETGTATTVAVTPGVQKNHPSAAKAWVYALNTTAIQSSYNVTSVSRPGVGSYTINFTVAFSAAPSCVVSAVDGGTVTSSQIVTPSTSTVSVLFRDNATNATADPVGLTVQCFGDQ